jgi:hypothetical protein
LLKILGELEQSQEVRYCAAIFAGPRANLLGAELKFLPEPGEGVGCLDRIKVFPLNVFDQRDLKQTFVGNFANYDRYFPDFGLLGGTPTPFARDQLVTFPHPADHQWLHDTVGADRLCKLRKSLALEKTPGLQWVGVDQVYRQSLWRIWSLGWRRRCG